MEFTDHYQIQGEIHASKQQALKAAFFNPGLLWFVRHGDGSCNCTCPEGQDEDEFWENHECDFEETWDVALDHGQYVNCAGYFVTAEPCRPEHRDTIFTY